MASATALPLCNFLYVTFEDTVRMLRNISATLWQFPESQLIIVDNSKPETQMANRNAVETLQMQAKAHITYVASSVNNRFVAYNTGLKQLIHPYTLFRTDDDIFEEAALRKLLPLGEKIDVLMTKYTYDGKDRSDRTFQRPIESCIFKTEILRRCGNFQTTPSSDWKYLEKVFQTSHVAYDETIVLRKLKHGRS